VAGTAPDLLPPGRLFHGRWEIVRVMVSGGMGALYEVVHQGTRRRAALKVMRPELIESAEMRERFRLETQLTAAIDSDHIVGVFDGGTDPDSGSPFLVMELLRGTDLHGELVRLRRLEPEDVVSYLRQVAWGLAKAHDAGIVHRDLKPENLFLTRRDDGSPCVKILDFGIAKLIAESVSAQKTTRAIGTPVYMAPEQIRGDRSIGPSADLYALAHVAYVLLVGAPYWREEHQQMKSVYPLLLAIVSGFKEEPTVRAARRGTTLPPAFDLWFRKATAPEPLDRHDSALELVDELEAVFSERGVPPTIRDPGLST
jgi:serine/threonine-protein kinase